MVLSASCLLTAGAGVATAQGSSQWSAEFSTQRAPITNSGVEATWATEAVQVGWTQPESAGWFASVEHQRRYGLVDDTAFTQGYVRTRNWTMLAAIGATPNADFMYRFTVGGELSRRIAGSTGVASLGYRFFEFPSARIQQLQPAFTWYFRSGEIQGRLFVTRNTTFSRTSGAGLVRAAHDITDRLRVGGGVAIGNRIFDVASLAQPTSARSTLAFADLRIGVTTHDFIQVGGSVAHEDPAFTYRSFSVGYRRVF